MQDSNGARMPIRLYLDEDTMSHGLVRALRARGIDVSTALESGMIERSDADHLEFASSQGRVLCTGNVGDFYRLHTEWVAQGNHHAGVVVIPQQRYAIGEQARRLLALIAERSAESMADQVEFLSAWG